MPTNWSYMSPITPCSAARPSGDMGWKGLGWAFSGPETMASVRRPSRPSSSEPSKVCSSTPIDPVTVELRAQIRSAATAVM